MAPSSWLRAVHAFLVLSVVTSFLPSTVALPARAEPSERHAQFSEGSLLNRPAPISHRPPATFLPTPLQSPPSSPLERATELLPAPPELSDAPGIPFIRNRGQADARAQFLVHYNGGTLFFTTQDIVFALPNVVETPARKERKPSKKPGASPEDHQRTFSVVRQHFVQAQNSVTLHSSSPLASAVNYLRGDDPGQWRTNVPTYSGLAYQQLYPGIDLAYTGTDGKLKSTFYVSAGADPSAIRWRYTGVTSVSIDTSGNLVVSVPPRGPGATKTLTITEQAPTAWQEINGARVPVAVRFTVAPNRTVGFSLGSYNPAYPLAIDPVLTYSTFLGGNALSN